MAAAGKNGSNSATTARPAMITCTAPAELAELADRARELLDKANDVYVIFNNHPRGQAVANALEMTHLLTGRACHPPPTLLAAFPRLAEAGPE
jgi:uncharacterized protein YecE (DUF72 family)